VNHT
ncbi:hypothetical protein D039_0759B, partial [Vibrio parahaemolyticus EKP-028]